MKRSFALVGLVLGTIAAAACSSSTSDDIPDASSSSGDMPGPEGGSPKGDSSMAADTSTPLTDSGSDSAADAGSDARADLSCAGLDYCEDFESYTPSTTAILGNKPVGPWTTSVQGAATMTIDTVRPYGGKNALHIKVPNGDTGASGLLNLTKAAGLVTGNNLWGRAMVYYAKTATDDLPNGVHSWIFQGQGKSTASGTNMAINVANHGDYYFLNYHGDTSAKPEASKSGGVPVAAAWLCVQWQYNGGTAAAPTDDAKVSVNGTQIIDATKAAEKWDFATPFTTMQFGFTHYQTLANAIDVYIDDFAVDKAVVPCPAP